MADIKIDEETVKRLRDKLTTYLDKEAVDMYCTDTIAKDVMYFFGVAIDEKEFHCADGFERFKKQLPELLTR